MPIAKSKPKLTKPIKPVSLFRGTDPSLWDFWRDGVTSSFLTSFLTCREQTRLSYVEGWMSQYVPLAFEFGTCCHWILEQVYGHQAELLRSYPDCFMDEDWRIQLVKKQVGSYEALWKSLNVSPSTRQLEQQELVYGLAEAVLPAYLKRWSGDFTGKYLFANTTAAPKVWTNLEEVFEIPYEFADGKRTFIRGRRDGVFKDKYGKTWVFDTKCRSIINNEDALDTLPFDLQQMLYLWVSHQEGLSPVGTIMNIIRRPGHRRGVDETLANFLERIARDVAEPKKFDHNFIRYQMAITKQEVYDFANKVLGPLMHDVRAWWEGKVPHYMNPLALISKYGRCSMFLPITKDEFGQCYKRNKAFSELADL